MIAANRFTVAFIDAPRCYSVDDALMKPAPLDSYLKALQRMFLYVGPRIGRDACDGLNEEELAHLVQDYFNEQCEDTSRNVALSISGPGVTLRVGKVELLGNPGYQQ